MHSMHLMDIIQCHRGCPLVPRALTLLSEHRNQTNISLEDVTGERGKVIAFARISQVSWDMTWQIKVMKLVYIICKLLARDTRINIKNRNRRNISTN